MASIRKILTHERVKGFFQGSATVANIAATTGSVVSVVAPQVGIPLSMVSKLMAVSAKTITQLVETIKSEDCIAESIAAAASTALHSAFLNAVDKHVDASWFSFENLDPNNQETRQEITAELLYQVNQEGELFYPAYNLLEDQLKRVLWPCILDTNEANFKACLVQVKADARNQYHILIQGQPDWVRDYFAHRERSEILGKVTGLEQNQRETNQLLASLAGNAVPPSAGSGFCVNTASGFVPERLALIFRQTGTDCLPNQGNILATAYAVSDQHLLTTSCAKLGASGSFSAAFQLGGEKDWTCVPIIEPHQTSNPSALLLQFSENVPFTREEATHWVTLENRENARVPFKCYAFSDNPGTCEPVEIIEGSFACGEAGVACVVGHAHSIAFPGRLWRQFTGMPCFAEGGLVGFIKESFTEVGDPYQPLDFEKLRQNEWATHAELIQAAGFLPADPAVKAKMPGECHINHQPSCSTTTHSFFSNESRRRRENLKQIQAAIKDLFPETRAKLAETLPNRGFATTAEGGALTRTLLALPLQKQFKFCHQVFKQVKKDGAQRPDQREVWLQLVPLLMLHDLDDHWQQLLDQLEIHDEDKACDPDSFQVSPTKQIYGIKAALLHAAAHQVSLQLSVTQPENSFALVHVSNGLLTSQFFKTAEGIVTKTQERYAAVDELLHCLFQMRDPSACWEKTEPTWCKEGMSDRDMETVRAEFQEVFEDLREEQRVIPFVLFDLVSGRYDYQTLCLVKEILPQLSIYQDDGSLQDHHVLRTNPGSYALRLIEFLMELHFEEVPVASTDSESP